MTAAAMSSSKTAKSAVKVGKSNDKVTEILSGLRRATWSNK